MRAESQGHTRSALLATPRPPPRSTEESVGRADVRSIDRTSELPALVVDAFRMAAGGWLAAYYARLTCFAPELLGRSGVWQSSPEHPQTAFGRLSLEVLALPRHGLEVWFVCGAGLALLIAVGFAPRGCAGLLLGVSAATYGLLQPAVSLDDFFAEAVPFWLLLLPTGRTLSVVRWRHWRRWTRERVDRGGWAGCQAFFLVFFLALGFLRGELPGTIVFGFFVGSFFAFAPLGVFRTLAVVPLVASLWNVAHLEGSALACAISIALCVLFLATEFAVRRPAGPPRPDAPVGLSTAIGWAAVVLVVVEAVASGTGMESAGRAAGAVLSNIGLSWNWDAPMDEPSDEELGFAFNPEGEAAERPAESGAANPRLKLMLGLLARSPSTAPDQATATFVKRLVRQHCGSTLPGKGAESRPRRPEALLLVRNGSVTRQIERFRCSSGGDDPDALALH